MSGRRAPDGAYLQLKHDVEELVEAYCEARLAERDGNLETAGTVASVLIYEAARVIVSLHVGSPLDASDRRVIFEAVTREIPEVMAEALRANARALQPELLRKLLQ